ncbi:efflux RND transporter permease subunit [sulfur-oxidizing endosymbiont of Gigantopelta aegis]|uniref:efflux RND transporter permease subunit n=1 Tax=sulfur-oxidizing endosymbiont of Gigantopelta aegis TaxID=2794934 RepID=UPI0018DB46F3|nr:efflux RND transporter permease subunit [sulfur-oxidizing endosymbiont of Gigantopelta aegis]
MNVGEYSVKNPVVSWLLVIVFLVGGYSGFMKMGKLEDPEFTIKDVKIITQYPGATAQQVYDEVTYHIEEALQLMPQIKWIKMSISRPGMSDISVTFQDKYNKEDFPDIYDEVRRKIADMLYKLPPGAKEPVVVDSFGDVYGVYVALSGDGYSYRDLKDTADFLKKELVLVNGVRKIVIGGAQTEVVYLDISRQRLGELGLSLEKIGQILQSQNVVTDAGKVLVGDEYLRIQPTGEFKSVSLIGDVLISSSDKTLIYLKDIAQIRREYKEVPDLLIYYEGKPALTIGVSMQSGENVVAVGDNLAKRMGEISSLIPFGMKLYMIYNQPVEVDNSVSGFMVNVAAAIVIVIVVLLLFMGVTAGLIIGAVLLITVAGTVLIMELYGIELQRISLGALIIALGMLVDNAIVIAEGMMVRIQAGMNAAKAAKEVVGKNSVALLGGTIIGILAFSAIGLSQDGTGEFSRTLFYVILISLLLSWVTAVSTTPLFCALFIKEKVKPKKGASGEGASVDSQDAYSGFVFMLYRNFLKKALHFRGVTVAIIVALFAISVYGFGFVRGGFFPDSNTPMFFVEVWEVEGTDIFKTRDDTLQISEYIRTLPGVTKTTELIGGGDQRFSLVYEPKERSPAYAQIIVQTETREQIADIWDKTDAYMKNYPNIEPIIKPLRIGPGRDSKIEARISGPDGAILRQLSKQAQEVFRNNDGTKEIRDDWRQPVKLVKPIFNEQVGRQLGINYENLSNALKYAFDGTQFGLYRDGIRLLPIFVRASDDEREDISNIQDIQVWSPVLQSSIPIAQVVKRFETVWENTVIRGRDRRQTIIASCNPETGVDTTELFQRLRPQIEAIELPPGYQLVWGGEYEDSTNASNSLASALPGGFLMMILTTILLFGKVRQPLIIWLTVPLALIGITAGLLALDGAFDFMGLLGALSLIGLLIKNAIVLIEEIDQQIGDGLESFKAILDSAVSRMRPVMMAAATTILGMIPLFSDVFFVNMSIIIMSGLAFASMLTLIVVPVLYAIFFKIKYREDA